MLKYETSLDLAGNKRPLDVDISAKTTLRQHHNPPRRTAYIVLEPNAAFRASTDLNREF